MCVQFAVAYFAYLRWAVTVPHGGGHTAPAGPAALPPHRPRPPVAVQALREGPERHTLPLVAPLAKETSREQRAGSFQPDNNTQASFQMNSRLYRT